MRTPDEGIVVLFITSLVSLDTLCFKTNLIESFQEFVCKF